MHSRVGVGQRGRCDVCNAKLKPHDQVEVLILLDGSDVSVVTTRGSCCARGELADGTARAWWLARGRLADGWYNEDEHQPIEDERWDGTPAKRRATIRSKIEEFAKNTKTNASGGADEVDEQARAYSVSSSTDES